MALKFAVIGHPIQHSRSPELHHAFAQKYHIALHYEKRLAELDQFESSVRQFFAHQGKGLNVTVPFKEQAFALCDHVSERARIAKSVNTLWQKNDKLYGDNTDGDGLVQALTWLGVPLKNANILVIGAGGATRGIIYPLAQAGVKSMCIANRTLSRAKQLVQDLSPYATLSYCDLNQLNGHYDLVINATSASLSTEQPLILPDQLQFDYAYEMAYGKESAFLKQAQQRHIPYADGWSMLVGQATESFFIWHGVKPQLHEFLELK